MNRKGIPSSTDAVILAGGLGTRLRAAVSDRPKPLAEIEGRPFLDLLVDELVAQGLRRFILCVGHHGNQIVDHFHRRREGEFLFSQELSPLGTGGAVRQALPLICSNPFLVMNGDSYCPVDLASLLHFHRSSRADATLVVTEARDRNDGGCIELTAEGHISAFREKAPRESAGPSLINAGVYVMERRLFANWTQPGPLSLERDLFPVLASEGNCFGFPVSAEVIDIGTPERYFDAQRRLPAIAKRGRQLR